MSTFHNVLTDDKYDLANYIIENTRGQKKPTVAITGVFTAFEGRHKRVVLLKSGELPVARARVGDLTGIMDSDTNPLLEMFGSKNRKLIESAKLLSVLERTDIFEKGRRVRNYGLIAVGGFNSIFMDTNDSVLPLDILAGVDNTEHPCRNNSDRLSRVPPSDDRTQAIAAQARGILNGAQLDGARQPLFTGWKTL